MTTTVAIVAPCAVIAFALWLEDRRRRERDADLIGEVRACRREVAELPDLVASSRRSAWTHVSPDLSNASWRDTQLSDIPEAWKDTP